MPEGSPPAQPTPNAIPKRYALAGGAFMASFILAALIATDLNGGFKQLEGMLGGEIANPEARGPKFDSLPKDMQTKFVALGRQVRRVNCLSRYLKDEPSEICVQALLSASDQMRVVAKELIANPKIAKTGAIKRVATDAAELAGYAREVVDAAKHPGGLRTATLPADAQPEALVGEAKRLVTLLDEALSLDDAKWPEDTVAPVVAPDAGSAAP
jgi:hypothetical protein